MKKIISLLLVVMTAATLSAKKYQHSLGMVAGLGIGAQYKLMVLDNFALIEEFGYFTCPDGNKGVGYGGAINNLVLAYQAKGTEGQGIELDWYVGGQIKGGYVIADAGLIGIGAAVGLEANMKQAPIAFSFDFRPGYGCILANWGGGTNALHMCDWSFNLGVRYTF